MDRQNRQTIAVTLRLYLAARVNDDCVGALFSQLTATVVFEYQPIPQSKFNVRCTELPTGQFPQRYGILCGTLAH